MGPILVVDRGNTFTKLGVFKSNELVDYSTVNDAQLTEALDRIIGQHQIQEAILSSVREDEFDLAQHTAQAISVYKPNPTTRYPFEIDYANAASLGMDRLANAAGAYKKFGKKNMLVVDCGTCTTYTLLLSGTMCGGTIAPGIDMRFKALNHYTGKLPLIEHLDDLPTLPGSSTEMSIRTGVELAAILETDAMIAHYSNISQDLTVLITGGDRAFFERHLKSPIFAAPYLTLEGLHEIYILNTY
jgi:type III pantothenate kinase